MGKIRSGITIKFVLGGCSHWEQFLSFIGIRKQNGRTLCFKG